MSSAASPVPSPDAQSPRLVASLWHLLMVLALLLLPLTGWIRLGSFLAEMNAPKASMYLLQFGIQWIFILLIGFGLALYGNGLSEIDLRWESARRFVHESAIGFAAMIVMFGVDVILFLVLRNLSQPARADRFFPTTPLQLLFFAPVAIMAGFMEELVFRGYLLKQFTALTRSVDVAVFIQAAIFAAAHGLDQSVISVADKFVFAVAMAWLAQWRKNLTSAMVAHALNDLIAAIVIVAWYWF